MGVITIISDWGLHDYYLSAVKGMIYRYNPEARIVDISHQVAPHDSAEAAFLLKNSFPSFPDGTVHIIGINTEESISRAHTVAYYEKQYFIGTDDGIFSLIFDHEPDAIIELDIPMESSIYTFSSRDRFAKAAAMLSQETKLEELGFPKEKLVEKLLFNPPVMEDVLKGIVIHVDNYKNLITNVKREKFYDFVKGCDFEITFRKKKYKIYEIHEAYGDVRPGEIVALFAGSNMMEIAINNGKAATLLGVRKGDPLVIERKPKEKSLIE